LPDITGHWPNSFSPGLVLRTQLLTLTFAPQTLEYLSAEPAPLTLLDSLVVTNKLDVVGASAACNKLGSNQQLRIGSLGAIASALLLL
jgi:hypothetical protein